MSFTASPPTGEQESAVLRELRKAGARGVHSHDLARRLPILNVPERIRRLRRAGWKITSTREQSPFGGRSWGTRYRLEGGPPVALVTIDRRRDRARWPRIDTAAGAADVVRMPRAA